MATKVLTGGEKLTEYLKSIQDKLSNPATLRVGFLEGATYPDGTPVAAVAAFNEFGKTVYSSEGNYYQLPRPFFRNMISDKRDEWGPALGHLLKHHGYDLQVCLEILGEGMVGQLRESITSLLTPPLAPSTIARKGFDKPLIDTAHMLNSVDKEVVT